MAMHIHHNPIANVSAGVHSAGAAEKAAAAQRASETRRKLMKNAGRIEAEAEASLDGEGILMVGKWSEESAGKQREWPIPGRKPKPPVDRESPGAAAISFWA